MSAPPPRWPTGPGRSSPPSAPWAPTAPTLVGRAAIGASGLGVGGGLAGAGGGGGAMGASASAQQPACACVGGDTCERRGCETVCVRFEHATAAHAVASEPAELLAGKRVVERGARLPAALEGAGFLGRRDHGEQGEQDKAGRPHLVVGHAVVGGRRRSRPVQRGRRVGGMRVVWGHRHGGRQQAAARAIRTQGMGGTPVDAGIHRARKESVCVRAQPVVQARRWKAFVCLWPRECVAQP